MRAPFWKPTYLAVLLGILIGVLPGMGGGCTPTPTRTTTRYQVHISVRGTADSVPGASVMLEVEQLAPLIVQADVHGYAMIIIPDEYLGEPGVLTVEATGYEKYWRYIDLDQGLPKDILLVPIPAATPTPPPPPTSTPTPARPTSTPAPTETPTPPPPTNTPTPTPTGMPEPSPTITPGPTAPFYCGTIGQSFEDDFSNPNSGWTKSEDYDGEANYVDGEFRISVDIGDTGMSTYHGTRECYYDFDMQVDIRRDGNIEAGYSRVRFGKVPGQSMYYELDVFTSGAPGVRLWSRDSAGSYPLTAIVGSDQINRDREVNTIRLVHQDRQLHIYVNDEKVNQVRLRDARWGSIGLAGCTCNSEEGGAEYYFDNFRITVPE